MSAAICFNFRTRCASAGVVLLLGYGSAYAAGEDWEVRLYTAPITRRCNSA